jgi:uncharacterized membrane-anchored protein
MVALVLALAIPAGAGTLEGRQVTFATMTWDDPAAPMFGVPGKTVTVGKGVEFGIESDQVVNGLSLVPVQVEILPQRVEVTFPKGMGNFYETTFNGYVLRFDTECALFSGWAVDRDFTTLPITDSDIFTDKGALYINVSGMAYGPEERLAVNLDVSDCPIS